MIRALKSYWAFTNGLYKLVMLVLLPIVLIVVNMYLAVQGDGDIVISLVVLYYIDTLSDNFFMGGFYSKNNDALEFLQSSTKFPRFAKEITIVDMVRRVLIYQIPFVIEMMYAIGNTEELEWSALNAFWPWLFVLTAQLVVVVSRHYVMWNQVYVCAIIGYSVMMLVFLFIASPYRVAPVITNLVLVVLVLIAGIITVRYTDKKVRESYYDK